MNYIWFNKDKTIKNFNIAYLVQESKNVDDLYIFTDDEAMDSLNCYVRFKRADTLVLGDFDAGYGSYEINGVTRPGWKLTINTNVLKVAGQLGIAVIFRKVVNGIELDYAQCYATTIVLKSVDIATELEMLLKEIKEDYQPRLTAGDNIIISGTVISVKLAEQLNDSNEVPSCALVKNYIDEVNGGFFEGLGTVLDEINGDVSNTKLETPVIYITGNTLTFNLIAGADEYNIYKDGTFLVTITASPYNLDNVITATGTYEITMTASGDGVTTSDPSEPVTFDKTSATPQLSAPVISASGNILSWSAIANATKYEIYNDGTKIATTTGLSYDFNSSPDGTYKFTVKATADGYITSDASNLVTYTKTTVVNQYVVTFDLNDENATGDAPASLTVDEGDTVDLTQYDSGFGLTGYTFLGWNTNPSASEGLASITVTTNTTVYAIWSAIPKLATPTGLSVSGTQLSWNAVTKDTDNNAVSATISYKVYVNDNNVLLTTTTGTTINFNSLITSPGTYYFKVQATATGYLDSEITAKNTNVKYVKSLSKMPAPTISIAGTTVSWNAVSLNVNGSLYQGMYRVYADGVELASVGTSTSYNLAGAFNTSGTYKIEVRAIGLSGVYSQSDMSNYVNYTFTASSTYSVTFSRADNPGDSIFQVSISSPSGNLDLSSVESSGTLTFNTTGVPVTIYYGGGSDPEDTFEDHTVGFEAISGSSNCSPTYSSTTKATDASYSETVTINGACSIVVTNTGNL